jgi:REP element-mobilizing transposase RayT
MNRGAARRRTFHTKHDARQFLALLGEASERFSVEVHAYCLMTNHYHLLVRCPSGRLSEFMHLVGSNYVRYLNTRLGQDGPLFRGRFHAIRLDTADYVDHVSRYVHRNPLDIRPAVALDIYEWSSFRYYVHDMAHPKWLRMNALLSEHGSRIAYRRYVERDERGISPARVWRWAVDAAVSELVDDASQRAKIRPAVALALLERVDTDDRPAIEQWLDFPNRDARRKALARMNQRRAASPLIDQITARAIALAA